MKTSKSGVSGLYCSACYINLCVSLSLWVVPPIVRFLFYTSFIQFYSLDGIAWLVLAFIHLIFYLLDLYLLFRNTLASSSHLSHLTKLPLTCVSRFPCWHLPPEHGLNSPHRRWTPTLVSHSKERPTLLGFTLVWLFQRQSDLISLDRW